MILIFIRKNGYIFEHLNNSFIYKSQKMNEYKVSIYTGVFSGWSERTAVLENSSLNLRDRNNKKEIYKYNSFTIIDNTQVKSNVMSIILNSQNKTKIDFKFNDSTTKFDFFAKLSSKQYTYKIKLHLSENYRKIEDNYSQTAKTNNDFTNLDAHTLLMIPTLFSDMQTVFNDYKRYINQMNYSNEKLNEFYTTLTTIFSEIQFKFNSMRVIMTKILEPIDKGEKTTSKETMIGRQRSETVSNKTSVSEFSLQNEERRMSVHSTSHPSNLSFSKSSVNDNENYLPMLNDLVTWTSFDDLMYNKKEEFSICSHVNEFECLKGENSEIKITMNDVVINTKEKVDSIFIDDYIKREPCADYKIISFSINVTGRKRKNIRPMLSTIDMLLGETVEDERFMKIKNSSFIIKGREKVLSYYLENYSFALEKCKLKKIKQIETENKEQFEILSKKDKEKNAVIKEDKGNEYKLLINKECSFAIEHSRIVCVYEIERMNNINLHCIKESPLSYEIQQCNEIYFIHNRKVISYELQSNTSSRISFKKHKEKYDIYKCSLSIISTNSNSIINSILISEVVEYFSFFPCKPIPITKVSSITKQIQINDPLYSKITPRSSLPFDIYISNQLSSYLVTSFLSQKGTNLPLIYCEPLTILQRNSEKFFFSSFLKQASSLSYDIPTKLLYITAFIIAELSSNENRYMFPLTPSQNETFEYINNKEQYRFFSEQVSSFPSISAYYAESNDFHYSSDTKGDWKYNIISNGLEYEEKSLRHLTLIKEKLSIKYKMPIRQIKNLTLGIPYIDYRGKVNVTVSNSNSRCELNFDKGRKGDFEGTIYNNANKEVYHLKGNWTDSFKYSSVSKKEKWITIWEMNKQEKYLNNKIGLNRQYIYHLPSYSLELNNGREILSKAISKNDSRFREDIIAYENGDRSTAQRINNKIKENNNAMLSPLYFSERSDNKEIYYEYKGGYFESRNVNII